MKLPISKSGVHILSEWSLSTAKSEFSKGGLIVYVGNSNLECLEQTNIDLTRVYLARSQPLRETSLCLMARLVTDLTPSILNNPQIKNYFPKVYGIYLVTISWIWSFCESVSCFGFKPSEPTHKIRATWLRCVDEIFSMTTLLPQYFNKLEWDWNSKVEIGVYILIWI